MFANVYSDWIRHDCVGVMASHIPIQFVVLSLITIEVPPVNKKKLSCKISYSYKTLMTLHNDVQQSRSRL